MMKTRSDNLQGSLPVPIAQTSALYLREWGYDCSVEERVSLRIPTKMLGDGMGLKWGGHDEMFHEGSGDLAVYDPTVSNAGPALLVRKDLIEKYLLDQELALVWMVFGGKQYMERDRKEWKGELRSTGDIDLPKALLRES